MPETSWPFHDGANGTPVLEDAWSIMARAWVSTGVVGYPGDDAAEVYANSSGRHVFVRPGRANVRGHWWDLDELATVPIAANSSGSPRIDRIVLRLDPTQDSIVLAVKQGTPAALPAPPAVTETDAAVYELALAQVKVPNGAATISASDVIDERVYCWLALIPCLSTRRPANPKVGQPILETDTGDFRWWTGSTWRLVTDVSGRVAKTGDTMTGTLFVRGGNGYSVVALLSKNSGGWWVASDPGADDGFTIAELNSAGVYVRGAITIVKNGGPIGVNGRKLAGLAPGTDSADAVNKSQLDGVAARVVGGNTIVSTNTGSTAYVAMPPSPTGNWAVSVTPSQGTVGLALTLDWINATGFQLFAYDVATGAPAGARTFYVSVIATAV